MKGIAVRDFQEKDTEKILQFRKETAGESFPGIEMNRGKARRAILRHMKRHPGTVKVAELEGKPIGLVMFKLKAGSLGSYGRITTIFVKKPYRNQGVGAFLLQEAEKSLLSKGIKRIYAEVTNTNTHSLDFFREHGYTNKRTVVEKRV